MRTRDLLVAVLDACVLYPPSLRDLFMRLASALAYQPRWTEEIHPEWMRNVLANRPEITPAQLERTPRLMDQISDESLVTGYEAVIPALGLPGHIQETGGLLRLRPCGRSGPWLAPRHGPPSSEPPQHPPRHPTSPIRQTQG